MIYLLSCNYVIHTNIVVSILEQKIPKCSNNQIYFTHFHTVHISKLQNSDQNHWAVATEIQGAVGDGKHSGTV